MWRLFLLTFIVLTAAPTTRPARDASWQTIEVLRADRLTVRLRVLDRAGLADEQWMGIEFDNAGNEAVRVENLQYWTDCEQLNLRTGAPWRSGSLASGTAYSLFPTAWETTPASPVLIPPGVCRILAQPSDYSSALLGLPPRDGCLVRARFHITIDLQRLGSFSTPREGVGFRFEWVYPDKAGFVAMRSRLRKLLESPERRAEHVYILGELLGAPGVGDDVPVKEILSALNARRGNMDGRDRLVSYVAEHFPKDPKVLEYYRQRLEARDARAMEDLFLAPTIWHPDFIAPLMAADGGAGRGIPLAALNVLSAHRKDWPPEMSIPARLSASVLRNSRLLSKKPDEVRGPDLPQQWESEARALALTDDPAVIPLLRPFLDNKERVLDIKMLAQALIFPEVPPLRVCDVALVSILTILGDDVHKVYRDAAAADDSLRKLLPGPVSRPEAGRRSDSAPASHPGRYSFDHSREALEESMNELRDKLIAELKQRLAHDGAGK